MSFDGRRTPSTAFLAMIIALPLLIGSGALAEHKTGHEGPPGCKNLSGPPGGSQNCTNPTTTTTTPRPPDYTCRASLIRVTGPAVGTFEPVVANDQEDPCMYENSTVGGARTNPVVLPGHVGIARGGFAEANVLPPALAVAAVTDVTLTPPGGPEIRIRMVHSEARASCQALVGDSRVVGLSIDGEAFDVPEGEQRMVDLGGSTLVLNEQTTTSDTITQRAAVLRTPLLDVVLAEAIADVHNCS